jgi:hypothetical protein
MIGGCHVVLPRASDVLTAVHQKSQQVVRTEWNDYFELPPHVSQMGMVVANGGNGSDGGDEGTTSYSRLMLTKGTTVTIRDTSLRGIAPSIEVLKAAALERHTTVVFTKLHLESVLQQIIKWCGSDSAATEQSLKNLEQRRPATMCNKSMWQYVAPFSQAVVNTATAVVARWFNVSSPLTFVHVRRGDRLKQWPTMCQLVSVVLRGTERCDALLNPHRHPPKERATQVFVSTDETDKTFITKLRLGLRKMFETVVFEFDDHTMVADENRDNYFGYAVGNRIEQMAVESGGSACEFRPNLALPDLACQSLLADGSPEGMAEFNKLKSNIKYRAFFKAKLPS